MNFIIDSVFNHNAGPKQKRRSALLGVLRGHSIVVPKSAIEACFYRPKRLIRSFDSSSKLSSATAKAIRRFSAKFSAQ
jgi:hypothetical protein